jgi:hypothetical protein
VLFQNAWLFEVINQLFGSAFPSGTPRFSISTVGAAGLPTSTPNQRFPAIVALLSQTNFSVGEDKVNGVQRSLREPQARSQLSYDWLQGRDWEELVVAALHTALERLPLLERPWGLSLRPTSALRPVGTGLPNPLGESWKNLRSNANCISIIRIVDQWMCIAIEHTICYTFVPRFP